MKVRLYAIAATLALLPLSGFTLSRLDGLSVKRQVKEGQLRKLVIKGDFEIAGTSAQFTGHSDEKVTKVNDDGSYTVEEKEHDMKVSAAGQDIPVDDIPAISTIFNADGTVKEILGDSTVASPTAYRRANLGLIVDSGKPLNIGDTWSYDIKADPKTGAEAATATYKLVAEEKIGDIDTLKIQATVKEKDGSEPATSDGFYWLDKGDASLVKAELTWSNAPFPNAPGPISGKLTMTRDGS
jgi:hypothetical protein